MLSSALQKMMMHATRFGGYAAELIKQIACGGIHDAAGSYAKTADYTVVAADTGKIFTTLGAAGAVNFTLPTIAHGLAFTFVNLVDQNMTITTNALGVHKNSITAASVACSTASQKMGSIIKVVAAYQTGTTTLKWLVLNLGGTTTTVA